MSTLPILKHLNDLETFLISPADTVKLTHLTGPLDGSPTSVFFEVWEPGGAQPNNSHPDSVEIFVVLRGQGTAISDEHRVDLVAGDVIILPEGSVHQIRNTSETERRYTLTVMASDKGAMESGFQQLVVNGTPTTLDAGDKAAILG